MQLYAAQMGDRPDDVWIQSGAASAVNDFGAALPCPERQNGIAVHFILLSNHTKSKKERLSRKIFRKSRSETPSISHLFRPKGPLSEGAGNAAGINWGSYHAKPHLEKYRSRLRSCHKKGFRLRCAARCHAWMAVYWGTRYALPRVRIFWVRSASSTYMK